MTLNETIAAMTADEVEQRVNQIKVEMDQPNANIDQLNEEYDMLSERRNAIKAEAEKRNQLAARIADNQVGNTINNLGGMETMENENRYNAGSPEYRNAWLKNMAVRGDGQRIFGELNEVEKRAYAMTTENAGAVVPTDIQNRIIELVQSDSPILDDAAVYNMTRGFGVPRHKSINAGDAKGVAEGAANVDEEDTFELVTLDGIEIKKHVVITRKMQFQSIDAFADWLVTHLAARIRVAKEKVILARLDGTAPDGGTTVAEAAIAAGNKMAGAAYDDTTIRSAMGKIKAAGAKVVYANNATIWNHLAGMENAKGDKLFVPNAMVDPVVQGRIYGAEVKVDSNLEDNVAYVGVKGKVLANNFDNLTIYSAIEPKTMNTIITAYALFDAALEEPEAYVKVTFTA